MSKPPPYFLTLKTMPHSEIFPDIEPDEEFTDEEDALDIMEKQQAAAEQDLIDEPSVAGEN